MRVVNLTKWSAPRLDAIGSTKVWKQTIDLKADIDFTPGWTRLKFIAADDTIRQVSILFRGRLQETETQEHFQCQAGSRFAAFFFASPEISDIRIDLCRTGTEADHVETTARPIWLAEYFYKTLPQFLLSPRKFVRYFYDPPFPCAVLHSYPRPDGGMAETRADATSDVNQLVDCFVRLASSRSFLSKQLWRRMLHGKRASAQTLRDELFRVGPACLLVGNDDVDPSLKRGIALYGHFRAELGLGQAARNAALALETTGYPVSRHAISIPNHFEEKVRFDCMDDPYSRYDTALIYINADAMKVRAPHTALAGKRRIGFWHWELPVFPAAWVASLDMVHEIFVPSRFVAESIATATSKPIRIIPHAVPAPHVSRDDARERLGLPRSDYLFLNVFDTNSFIARKNPTGIIRAFLDAFPARGDSSPRLVLKYHGMARRGAELSKIIEQCSLDDRIILIDKVYSMEQMGLLQAACDAFVSLHRSEGYGLNIAECMALGKIAIATAYSGNLDFMTADNSMLVPYSMRRVAKGEYLFGDGQWWAEPDHSAAVEALRMAASQSAHVKRLETQARVDMLQNHSYARVGDLLLKAVRGEIPDVNRRMP
jgi:glycosyltransferase involved in cell wall biosynthesis